MAEWLWSDYSNRLFPRCPATQKPERNLFLDGYDHVRYSTDRNQRELAWMPGSILVTWWNPGEARGVLSREHVWVAIYFRLAMKQTGSAPMMRWNGCTIAER